MANESILTINFYYSPSTGGCYPESLYDAYVDSGTWPTDGVKISEEIHTQFFLDSTPEGKERYWDPSTKTFKWIDVPTYQYSEEEKKSIGRVYRNNFVIATDVMMLSDYTINDTLLTDDQKKEVADTRIAFKTWPTLANWWNTSLPSVPQWIIDDANKNRNYNHPTTDQWPLPPFA